MKLDLESILLGAILIVKLTKQFDKLTLLLSEYEFLAKILTASVTWTTPKSPGS